MSSVFTSSDAVTLRARLHQFCFPFGGKAARRIRGVRIQERGEIRASADARWTPFIAEQTIEATRSGFRWEAQVGPVSFIDSYEAGEGMAAVQPRGGPPVEKAVGPEIDQAGLQRYLASIPLCPPILLNHPSLEWAASGEFRLRVCDLEDPTGAAVDLELDEDGRPVAVRAERARLVGRETVMTPWRGTYSGYRERRGLMVPDRVDVFWGLQTGEFQYFRSEVISLELL